MPQETPYSATFDGPDYLARATTQTIACAVFYDGQIATVASGTVTVKDGAGDEIVAAGVVTVVAGVATYSVTAAVLPATLAYSDDWMIFWSLVLPDGRTYPFKNSAALVHSRLYCPVAQGHLTERHTELAQWVREYDKSLQPYITAAWREGTQRLEETGRRTHLILNSSALFLYVLKLSLAFAFRDYSTSLQGGRYAEIEAQYLKEAEEAWQRISLRYDEDEDQIPDDERIPAGPPVMLMRPGRWWN